jgi:hypothetical protein
MSQHEIVFIILAIILVDLLLLAAFNYLRIIYMVAKIIRRGIKQRRRKSMLMKKKLAKKISSTTIAFFLF